MQATIFSIKEFTDCLKECLKDISLHMKRHPGISHVIKSRFKFEKWFQIELLGRLIEKTTQYQDITWYNEIGISTKISKKGKTIDMAVKRNGENFIGIELKIIPTNYIVDGFETKPMSISDSIKEVVSDLKKCSDDGYAYQFSIGLVFPLPIDLAHRNHNDFEKQLQKLRLHGNLISVDCQMSEQFIARYYILSNC